MTDILKELDEVLAAETGYQRAIAAGDFLLDHAPAIRAALELQAQVDAPDDDRMVVALRKWAFDCKYFNAPESAALLNNAANRIKAQSAMLNATPPAQEPT